LKTIKGSPEARATKAALNYVFGHNSPTDRAGADEGIFERGFACTFC